MLEQKTIAAAAPFALRGKPKTLPIKNTAESFYVPSSRSSSDDHSRLSSGRDSIYLSKIFPYFFFVLSLVSQSKSKF